ncbi:MAG: hypothetical protein ACRDD7_14110 [Peptostreptococcaceae bacterium]
MENVKQLISEISTNLSQKSSCQKDEIAVMKAMLNDKEYEVGVYGKDGLESTFSPAKEAREMISSVISTTTKLSTAESDQLADEHEFSKKEAASMVGISKEFVNTYLETGRKLPLGGRETSDVSLIQKKVESSTRNYPKRVGVNDDGTPRYESVPTEVKAHTTARVISPCPSWIK